MKKELKLKKTEKQKLRRKKQFLELKRRNNYLSHIFRYGFVFKDNLMFVCWIWVIDYVIGSMYNLNMYNRNHYGLGGGNGGRGPYIRKSPPFVMWSFLLIVAIIMTVTLCVFYSPWFAFLSIGDLAILYKTIESTSKMAKLILWVKDFFK